MRCFVAMDLPAAVRAQLVAAAAPLRRLGDVRWVDERQLHVTLKFLGDAERSWLDAVTAVLDRGVPRIELQLAGLGQFPGRAAPRVIWGGFAGDVAAAQALAKDLERAAVAAGAPAEPRPFRAHVTLGRARSPRGGLVLHKAIADASSQLTSAPFVVPSVTLYRSELLPAGAVHDVVRRWACPTSP